MVNDIETLLENGCSDKFIFLLKKYNNPTTLLKNLDKFIQDIEEYKRKEKLLPTEENILEEAKKIYSDMNSEPIILKDDSTEDAIRRIETDYTGDTFTADGYEYNTDDGCRY